MPDLIQFQNVSLGYGRRAVLDGLNFSVRDAEFFAMVGANASGKTTILRAMLGILKPLRGNVLFHHGAPPKFGYVPQRDAIDEIFPLSAREVVMMGACSALGAGRQPTARERSVTDETLAKVGLSDVASKLYRDLSGGQKQRALIARALATGARVLAFDEPTNGMDLEGERAIIELIQKLRADNAATVVFVSHYLNLVANLADRILLLHDGVARIGTAEEILTADILREVYGVTAHVETVGGKRVIVA